MRIAISANAISLASRPYESWVIYVEGRDSQFDVVKDSSLWLICDVEGFPRLEAIQTVKTGSGGTIQIPSGYSIKEPVCICDFAYTGLTQHKRACPMFGSIQQSGSSHR